MKLTREDENCIKTLDLRRQEAIKKYKQTKSKSELIAINSISVAISRINKGKYSYHGE